MFSRFVQVKSFLLCFLCCLAVPLYGQQLLDTFVQQYSFVSVKDQVSVSGDINGDGFNDILLLLEQDSVNNSTKLIVLSGKDGSLLIREGQIPLGHFGSERRDVELYDVNGDGADDIILGDGNNRVQVFSGTTARSILSLSPTRTPFRSSGAYSDFGLFVDVENLDGAGPPEIITGIRNGNQVDNVGGVVTIYNGSTGEEICSNWYAYANGDREASAVTAIGDVDRDGV